MYGNYLTPGVKNLIVLNVIAFLLQVITGQFAANSSLPIDLFALNYWSIVENFRIWTVFTYMFLHGGFWHLLFNMLALFFFGCEIERSWGTANFMKFYLISGLGAGVIIFAYEVLKVVAFDTTSISFTLGASGAIFGVLLAYSLVFSERQITVLLFFIIPVTIRAKYLIFALLGITFLFSAFFVQNISHVGHIGGVLSGILFLLAYRNQSPFAYPYGKMKGWFKVFKRGQPRSFSTYNRVSKNKFSLKTFMQNPRKPKVDFPLDETLMSDHEIEEKIDELLDIISQRGLKSLSKDEKDFLTRVSLLYRHKFPN